MYHPLILSSFLIKWWILTLDLLSLFSAKETSNSSISSSIVPRVLLPLYTLFSRIPLSFWIHFRSSDEAQAVRGLSRQSPTVLKSQGQKRKKRRKKISFISLQHLQFLIHRFPPLAQILLPGNINASPNTSISIINQSGNLTFRWF